MDAFLDFLVMINKHTMVAYAVGYHRDVFTDKKAALENRICFVNWRMSQGKGELHLGGVGWGGAGGGKYCWALLDWPMRAADRPAPPVYEGPETFLQRTLRVRVEHYEQSLM
jgi:hypothetical protein